MILSVLSIYLKEACFKLYTIILFYLIKVKFFKTDNELTSSGLSDGLETGINSNRTI